MRYKVLLMVAVLISAVCVIAQSGTEKRPGGVGPSGAISITGCLQGQGEAFTVTDKSSGWTYHLGGDRDLFEQHKGQEVTISGIRTGQSMYYGDPGSPTVPAVSVKSMNEVANGSCSKQ